MSKTEDILSRIRLALGVENDNQLYKALNLSSNAVIPGWKKRDSIPIRWINEVATRTSTKTEWLMTGEGEKEDTEIVYGLPSLSAALYIAKTNVDGINKLNALLDGFIIEQIIQKLLHFHSTYLQNKNSIIDRIKKVLFNVSEGRFLMMLDEMLSKLPIIDIQNQEVDSKKIIYDLVEGEKLNSFLTKPIYKENEKAAFQLWAESLTDDEARFIINNSQNFKKELSILIPKISKNHTALDVSIMRKLTS